MSTAVEQIKSKLGIVEVVGTYVKLEKAGINYKACCPFHHEKTPSFFVSTTRQSYHCFGCNQGGDIFSFVQEIEGLDFLGALKVLAERAGVTLDSSYRQHQFDPLRDRLYEILNIAKNYYVSQLKTESKVQDYLSKRGLSQETISNFGIGWIANEWQNLYHHLSNQGYSNDELEKSGLVILSSSGGRSRYYDRFRGRIMFPLRDNSGRVVGFSGRIFGSADDGKTGKYINSPQTIIYDKSRLLYGYPEAKLEIRRADEVILVEGQFDLVLSHQAGVVNTVAVSGTALTREHLELLSRLTTNITMAFDGDRAGFSAASRAIEIGLTLGLEIKIVVLPPDLDPADLIVRDPQAWRQAITKAKHVIDFLLSDLHQRNLSPRLLAHAIHNEVYPYVARLSQRIDQAHFIAKIANLTGLSEEVIRADIADLVRSNLNSGHQQFQEKREREKEIERPVAVTRADRIAEKIFGLWHWQNKVIKPALIELITEAELEAINQTLSARQDELVLTAELLYEGYSPQELQQEGRTLATSWRSEVLRDRLGAVMRQLAMAEQANNREAAEQYLKQCQDLSRQINDLKK